MQTALSPPSVFALFIATEKTLAVFSVQALVHAGVIELLPVHGVVEGYHGGRGTHIQHRVVLLDINNIPLQIEGLSFATRWIMQIELNGAVEQQNQHEVYAQPIYAVSKTNPSEWAVNQTIRSWWLCGDSHPLELTVFYPMGKSSEASISLRQKKCPRNPNVVIEILTALRIPSERTMPTVFSLYCQLLISLLRHN